MSQMLPTTRHSISLVRRTNIAVLVGLSRLLRHLKPHRLQRLMSFVVRGAQPADYSIARDARDDILSASADEPIDASYLRTFYRVGASAQA